MVALAALHLRPMSSARLAASAAAPAASLLQEKLISSGAAQHQTEIADPTVEDSSAMIATLEEVEAERYVSGRPRHETRPHRILHAPRGHAAR